MTERVPPGGDQEHDLEGALGLLATDVVFPATPVFTMPRTAVRDRNDGPLARSGAWWKAGLAAAGLLAATSLAIPDSREAVADWLGFPGIRIEIGDRPGDPPPTVTSIGGSLLLGEAVTLGEAASAVDFGLVTPGAGVDGIRPEVFLNRFQDSSVVSFLYPASSGLPAIGDTGVGLLLMQIDATGDTAMLIGKRASAESPPQSITVDDAEGLWIEGGVLMADAGDPFWTYQRRSGNVLVWERGGVTYRMECNVPLDDALAIAESLHAIDDVP